MVVEVEPMREDTPGGQTPQPKRGSLLDNLKPYVWSDEESVAYEVAIEATGEVVGVCSSKLSKERVKPEPDPDVIAAWHDEIRRWVKIRRALDPTNHDQIARVRREAPAHAQYLRQRQIP